MRILIVGEGLTARALRSLVAMDQTTLLPGVRRGHATVALEEDLGVRHPHVDGIDSSLELAIVTHLAKAGKVTIDGARGRRMEHNAITVRVPKYTEESSHAVEQAVYHGLLDAARPKTGAVQRPAATSWGRRLLQWLGLAGVVFLLSAAPAAAQVVAVRDATTGVVVPNIGNDANDAIRVYCVGGTCTGGGGGGGGTSEADRAAFTFGVTNLTPIGGVFDDTPPAVLTTGMVGVGRMTSRRALHVNLRDNSGNEITSFPVTGTFWPATQPISAAVLPLPAGASTAALQTQPGVDIGDVTINNAAGAAAVNIQDGGNSITIDATALPLPVGAATSALQTTGNTSLGNIDTSTSGLNAKFPAVAAITALTANPTVTKIQTFPAVQNSLGSWDPLTGGSAAADGVTSPASGVVNAREFAHLYNGATWDRAASGSLLADATGATASTGNANVRGFMFGYNGAGTFDRVRTGSNAADNVVTGTLGNVQSLGFNFVWDSSGGNWDRMKGDSTDGVLVNLGANNDVTVTNTVNVDTEFPAQTIADNMGNPGANALLGTASFSMVWDSLNSQWMRLRNVQGGGGSGASSDAEVNPRLSSFGSYPYMYNGATWDRARGSAADGLTVNLGANNDVTVTGTVTADTELAAAAALTDAFANPTTAPVGAFTMKWNSGPATWSRWDGAVTVSNTVAISAAALPLPANAAQEAGGNLAAIKTNTDPLVAAGAGGYVRQDSTATIAKETGGNLATVKTNTDPLVVAGGGGYVRQDSTATIAKETGGNLATVKTNTDPFVVAAAGGYVRQDSTGTIAKETGGNLATVKTNTDPLIAAAAGGYIRQDSTATIAKETGGNLATLVTQTDTVETLLTTIASLVKAIGATQGATDPGLVPLAVNQPVPLSVTNTQGAYEPLQVSGGAVWVRQAAPTQVIDAGYNPLLQFCNKVRRTNCRPVQ